MLSVLFFWLLFPILSLFPVFDFPLLFTDFFLFIHCGLASCPLGLLVALGTCEAMRAPLVAGYTVTTCTSNVFVFSNDRLKCRAVPPLLCMWRTAFAAAGQW